MLVPKLPGVPNPGAGVKLSGNLRGGLTVIGVLKMLPGVTGGTTLPKLPGVAGVPKLPGVAGVPREPGVAGAPNPPGIAGTPKEPGADDEAPAGGGALKFDVWTLLARKARAAKCK